MKSFWETSDSEILWPWYFLVSDFMDSRLRPPVRVKSYGLNQFVMVDFLCICMRCICIIGLLPNAQMLQIGTDKKQVFPLAFLFSPSSYLIWKIQNFTQCHSEAVKHSKIQTIGPFLDFRNESQKMSKDQIIQIT